MTIKVFTQIDRLFQGAQAYLTGFARLDVCFDILAGWGGQFLINILRKPFEQRHAVFVGMVGVSLFHNRSSMLL